MKRGLVILSVLVVSILLISIVYSVSVSALSFNDFSDFFKNFWQRITGKATENAPPTATLSASPLSGEAPLTVSFEISCSDPDNNLAICSLEFGDNSAAPYISENGKPVSKTTQHTYNSAGTYTVTLKAIDYKMLESKKELTIVVTPSTKQPPVQTESPSASPSPTISLTCTDSDGKDNFDVAGEVTYGDKIFRDYCDTKFPNIAYDYYCLNNKPDKTKKNCSEEGKICENGVCIEVQRRQMPLMALALSYWKFDEGTGSVATDSSGNNNDGTIKGATFTSGMSNKALLFDGKDDYVEVPQSNTQSL